MSAESLFGRSSAPSASADRCECSLGAFCTQAARMSRTILPRSVIPKTTFEDTHSRGLRTIFAAGVCTTMQFRSWSCRVPAVRNLRVLEISTSRARHVLAERRSALRRFVSRFRRRYRHRATTKSAATRQSALAHPRVPTAWLRTITVRGLKSWVMLWEPARM
jgi:hypothetical protein